MYRKGSVDTYSLIAIAWQSTPKKKENTVITNARAGNKLKISADFSSDADVSGSRKKFTHLG